MASRPTSNYKKGFPLLYIQFLELIKCHNKKLKQVMLPYKSIKQKNNLPSEKLSAFRTPIILQKVQQPTSCCSLYEDWVNNINMATQVYSVWLLDCSVGIKFRPCLGNFATHIRLWCHQCQNASCVMSCTTLCSLVQIDCRFNHQPKAREKLHPKWCNAGEAQLCPLPFPPESLPRSQTRSPHPKYLICWDFTERIVR